MKHTISQLQFILDSAGLNTKVMGSRTGVHEYPALIVRDNFSFRHIYAELAEQLQDFLDGEHKTLTVDYSELSRLEDVHLMCSTIAFYTEPPTSGDFVKAVRVLHSDGDFGQQKQIKVIISFPLRRRVVLTMQLSYFSIKNIRSIKQLKVNLREDCMGAPTGAPRRRLILLGSNGSGKTTVLDALAHAFQELGSLNYEYGARELDGTDLRLAPDLSALPGSVAIEGDVYFDDDIIESGKFTSHVERSAEASYASLMSSRAALLDMTRAPFLLLPSNRGVLEPGNAQPSVYTNPCRNSLSKAPGRFAGLEAMLALALVDNASDLGGKFTRMWKVFAKYLPDMPKPVHKTGPLTFHVGGREVPVDALSDGERAILLMFGEIAWRAKSYSNIMIDDVEQHLHPKWQRAVLEGLNALAPTSQFILTTQSPFLAACAPDDVLSMKGAGT